jgi:hypothetical protein
MTWSRWSVALGVAGCLACSGVAQVQSDPAPAASDPAKEAPKEAPAQAASGPTDADLVIPTDALVLAQKLAQVERTIRDPKVDDAEAGRWGHVQQRIYRTLAADEVLANAVQASIPAELKDVVAKNLFGTKEIALTVTKPKTDLPDWRRTSTACRGPRSPRST